MLDNLINQNDTITDSIQPIKQDFIFTGHELIKKNKDPILNPVKNDFWTIILFGTILSLIVVLRINNEKKYLLILKSFFSLSSSRQLLREDYRINKGTSVLLIIIFLIGIPFFLLKVNAFYNYYKFENEFAFYMQVLLILLIVYSLKFITLISISTIFNSKEIVEEYINHIFFSLKAIGIFIFPLLVLLEFSKLNDLPIIFSGFIFCLIFYSIRVSRGILILMNEKSTSISHIFLYFCSLEILPLMVIIKLIIEGPALIE
jgi:hypothetical protein